MHIINVGGSLRYRICQAELSKLTIGSELHSEKRFVTPRGGKMNLHMLANQEWCVLSLSELLEVWEAYMYGDEYAIVFVKLKYNQPS